MSLWDQFLLIPDPLKITVSFEDMIGISERAASAREEVNQLDEGQLGTRTPAPGGARTSGILAEKGCQMPALLERLYRIRRERKTALDEIESAIADVENDATLQRLLRVLDIAQR